MVAKKSVLNKKINIKTWIFESNNSMVFQNFGIASFGLKKEWLKKYTCLNFADKN